MTAIDVMTRIAWEWGARCFGKEHMEDTRIRALRCAEEAIELAQASGVDPDTLYRLVKQVFDRPDGNLYQELGGTLLTACVLTHSLRTTPAAMFERELQRCLAKNPEHFAQRNQEKIWAGLK